MERIIDRRGTGKTFKLMSAAAKNKNGIIVCSNPYSMAEKAKSYGIVGIDFISYQDFFNMDFNTNKEVYIDELENFIKSSEVKFAGYTLSNED